jgi:branched-subunit amino acid aminotransferase/4-amino-4-deoxychorismate lyase
MPADFSWASPALRDRIAADPAAVLRDRGVNAGPEIPIEVMHDFIRVLHLLWVDGEIVPIDQFRIDPADEGLLFGRGVWESTRTVGGAPWLWPLHLDRIRQSAEVLGINVAADRFPNADTVTTYVKGLSNQDVVLRLNATAGRPGHPGIVWMSASPPQFHPVAMRLRTQVNPVMKGQPYLLLKTFQYATRLRIGQSVADGKFDSALMLDADQNILEAAHANLFVKFADGWATPLADGSFLPGTVRHVLLDQKPLPIREERIPASKLGHIQEAFCTNSNVGIVPVIQIDNFQYPVGNDTKALMKWLEPPAPAGVRYLFKNRQSVPR